MDHVFIEKDLGVTVDTELSFHDHITKAVNKANAIVGLIRRAFSYLNKGMFLKIYTAIVRPHLEYAQVVWSPHSMKYIDLIENVQIRATKLVDNFQNKVYADRLKELKMQTLSFRRLRGDLIEMYKHFNRYDKDALPYSFKPKLRPSRNHRYQVYEPRPRDGDRGAHSNFFYTRISRTWNELPSDVVDAGNINTFKARLDIHLKNHPLKYDHKAITIDS